MRRIFVAAACVVALAGCGSKGYTLAPVSGTVTMDGKPMAGVHVTFTPLGSSEKSEAGPGSHAVSDAQGRFTLVASTGAAGAVVGKHRVLIEAAQPAETEAGSQSDGASSEEAFKARLAAATSIPSRYNRETTLGFEVPKAGTTTANFELNSSKDSKDSREKRSNDNTDPAAP